MKLLKHSLKESNYYQDKEYLNHSTLKIYSECESKALAISKDEYKQNYSSTALLVGSYVDSAIEGTLEKFKANNPEIYKYKNPEKGLKSEFIEANKMIEKIKKDKYAVNLLTGEKQMILVGEIEGVKVKCKLDNINIKKGFFTDLKTCRDIYETMWNDKENERQHFIQARGYISQLAFYQEIIRQNFDKEFMAWIVAYDKTENLRGLCVKIEQQLLDSELKEIKTKLRRHKELIELDDSERCEKCDYCNSTRKDSRIFLSFEEMIKNI